MNIFSHKELVPTAPSGNGQVEQTANPYLEARRQSNSQIDRAFGSLHVWQLIAVASLLIALACVAGIIYFGSQTKYVPYVIEVDKLGEAVAVGPAQLAAPADPRVVRASLAGGPQRRQTRPSALERATVIRSVIAFGIQAAGCLYAGYWALFRERGLPDHHFLLA